MIDTHPDTCNRNSVDHYNIVADAIHFIRTNHRHQPSLGEIAAAVSLSEFHLQRIFTEWAGISPKRFLQYLTKEYARQSLQQSMSILSTTLDAGLSSPGRLHDLMVTCEALTPGEIKARGKGVNISFGLSPTPFGIALLGWTDRGICYLAFCESDEQAKREELMAQWPAAQFFQDDTGAIKLGQDIFIRRKQKKHLHLLLRGTNFQIKVWEALLQVAPSQVVTYSTLASLSQTPKAHRAVGTALAANTIGFLIPCHRVIRGTGEAGHYRWDSQRKSAMLAWEAGRHESKNE